MIIWDRNDLHPVASRFDEKDWTNYISDVGYNDVTIQVLMVSALTSLTPIVRYYGNKFPFDVTIDASNDWVEFHIEQFYNPYREEQPERAWMCRKLIITAEPYGENRDTIQFNISRDNRSYLNHWYSTTVGIDRKLGNFSKSMRQKIQNYFNETPKYWPHNVPYKC